MNCDRALLFAGCKPVNSNEGIRCLKKCWKEHDHIITEDEKAVMKAFAGVLYPENPSRILMNWR
jgi:hypothetical protein